MGDYQSCLLQALQRAQRERHVTTPSLDAASTPPASTPPSGRPETSPITVMQSPARTIKAQHDAFHVMGKDSLKEIGDLARNRGIPIAHIPVGALYGKPTSPDLQAALHRLSIVDPGTFRPPYNPQKSEAKRLSDDSTSSGGSHNLQSYTSGEDEADILLTGRFVPMGQLSELPGDNQGSAAEGHTPLNLVPTRNSSTSSDEHDMHRGSHHSPDSHGSSHSPYMDSAEHLARFPSRPASSSAPGNLMRSESGGLGMHMRGSYGLGGYQSRSSLSGDEGEAYRHGYNGYGGRGGGGSGRSVTMFGEQQRGVPAGRPIGGYGSGARAVGRSFSDAFQHSPPPFSTSPAFGGAEYGEGGDLRSGSFLEEPIDTGGLPQSIPPMEKWCKYRVDGSWCTQKRCRFYPCNTENRSHWPNRCWRCRRSNCPGGC